MSERNIIPQVNDDQKFTGVRLPDDLKPRHYDLNIEPNLRQSTYEGWVQIEYVTNSSKPMTEVVINCRDLVISDGYIEDKKCWYLVKVTYSSKSETATLEFSRQIPEFGIITLEFRGTLNDNMCGFYRSAIKYKGESVYAASTHFEPTYARRCFPCFDEPALKATFTVSIRHQTDTTLMVNYDNMRNIALSNTMESSFWYDNSGKTTVSFEKTPLMSTYLLAFVVGPFEMIEGRAGGCKHRVFTAPGKKELGKFALDISQKSLKFYENYFQIPYPLKKLDLIAIPDFSIGAMENWGLITFRESCLLVDTKNTATSIKQHAAIVITHEIAHQWFGNLVTMEWWTHLWLKEGFATFMSFLCTNHIFPEWDMWSQFVCDSHAIALRLDSLLNSHPIEVTVEYVTEIDEIFDAISYEKGSAIIRMLHQYIGDEKFKQGMFHYLDLYRYKNAVTQDLWKVLEKTSKKPVCQIMSGWTLQKGYPWLSVSYSPDGGDSLKLSLTQSKFSADGTLPTEDANSVWMVPIDALTGSNPSEPVHLGLLSSSSDALTVEGAKHGEWVKLNPSCVGLYRTVYPEEMFKKLLPEISAQTLPPTDRFNLLSDYFALCQAGKVQTTDLLKLLEAYKKETNYIVWRSIDGCFENLSKLLYSTDYREKLFEFGRGIYADIFKKLNWNPLPDEKHTDAMTRSLVIFRLVSFGEESVIEEAKRLYKAHLNKTETIPADMRRAVYKAISTYGDDEDFDGLFKLHRESELDSEKESIAGSLVSSRDSARRSRAIDFVLSDEVKNQNKAFVLMNIDDVSIAWDLLREHKDTFIRILQAGHLLTYLVKFCTQNFTTLERADEVSKFFEENEFPGCERTIQQSIEIIRINSKWLARDNDAIRVHLSSL